MINTIFWKPISLLTILLLILPSILFLITNIIVNNIIIDIIINTVFLVTNIIVNNIIIDIIQCCAWCPILLGTIRLITSPSLLFFGDQYYYYPYSNFVEQYYYCSRWRSELGKIWYDIEVSINIVIDSIFGFK